MGDTATATATTDKGPVQIEVQIPDANNAAAWNEALKTGAEKAGVEVPGVTEKPAAAAAATVDTTKKDDQPILYKASLTVNGKEMVFEDANPAKVLEQYTAAVTASQLAGATAAIVEEKKPEVAAMDMFDIGAKLIAGDASGLKDYLKKSNILGEMLAEEGISIEQIKEATQKTLSNAVHDEWNDASNQLVAKVKAGESDFPGGQQNMKMMGIMLSRLEAQDKAEGKKLPRTVETMERAYALMKKEELVFPVGNNQQATTTITEKKIAPGSTAVGTAGNDKQTANAQQAIPLAQRKFEIDMTKMSNVDANRVWNDLIDQGIKPEQINVIQ